MATADQWSWVDVDGAVCDDGSPTGVGFYPSTKSDNLLVFFEGGGACWDYLTCAQLNTSAHGPFGATEFAAVASGASGSVLDHGAAGNPFKDWSAVFVPYCTGDVHSGDNVVTYTGSGAPKEVHHKGRVNAALAIDRLVSTFPRPAKVVVSGSSAGGGGALFNYPMFRAAWPSTPMYLVDDSLPLFVGDAMAPSLRTGWFASWNLGPLTDAFCTAACRDDMSLYMKAVAEKFPGDRLALVSSEQDEVIRTYYQLTPEAYSADLTALAANVLEPTGNFRHFFHAGEVHTTLGEPANVTTSSGVVLSSWLTQMVGDDPAWISVGP